jgi:hypothetical protein
MITDDSITAKSEVVSSPAPAERSAQDRSTEELTQTRDTFAVVFLLSRLDAGDSVSAYRREKDLKCSEQ